MYPAGTMIVNLKTKHAYIKKAEYLQAKTPYGRTICIGSDSILLYEPFEQTEDYSFAEGSLAGDLRYSSVLR